MRFPVTYDSGTNQLFENFIGSPSLFLDGYGVRNFALDIIDTRWILACLAFGCRKPANVLEYLGFSGNVRRDKHLYFQYLKLMTGRRDANLYRAGSSLAVLDTVNTRFKDTGISMTFNEALVSFFWGADDFAQVCNIDSPSALMSKVARTIQLVGFGSQACVFGQFNALVDRNVVPKQVIMMCRQDSTWYFHDANLDLDIVALLGVYNGQSVYQVFIYPGKHANFSGLLTVLAGGKLSEWCASLSERDVFVRLPLHESGSRRVYSLPEVVNQDGLVQLQHDFGLTQFAHQIENVVIPESNGMGKISKSPQEPTHAFFDKPYLRIGLGMDGIVQDVEFVTNC